MAPAARAESLRQGLALRMALVLLLALGALWAVVVVITDRANATAAAQQLDDAALYLERRLAAVDRSWKTQAELLRSQLDFARLLDEPDREQLRARLTAFLAAQGGEGLFTHLLLVGEDGTAVFRFRSRSQQDLDPPPPERGAAAWVYGERDAIIYRVILQPVLVAGRPGRLVVFVPVDSAVLSANAYPGSAIELRWHGRTLIGPRPGAAGASEPEAPAGATREIAWAGDFAGPTVLVSRPPVMPLTRGQATTVAWLGGAAVAVLGWLVLGRWLAGHAKALVALQSATAAFSREQRVTPDVAAALTAAGASGVREVGQLGQQAIAMMQAVERAQAQQRQSQAAVEQANASLEDRVRLRTRELELARDDALSATRAKEQFLANISHELRTPLAGMLGSLELVRGAGLEPLQREMLDISRSSAQALLALINELLDFSKVEAGKLTLEAEAVSPPALLRDVVQLFSAMARTKGVALRAEIDGIDAGLLVLCDRLRLRQVLLNLTGNAVKFTDTGSVVLSVAIAARDEHHATLRFAVQDSGVGIAEEDRARIFLPFVQGAAAARRGDAKGTGLGLAISQRLVGAMGGRIELDSTPGQGTRFHFALRLPLAPSGGLPVAASDAAAQPLVPLRGRVLLVDDNLVNRLVGGEMLRQLGLDVAESENGRDAVERVAAEAFDLVLMDCLMPVLDGYAATRTIREGERRAGAGGHLPICALTANALPADVERAHEAGMDAHLTKPFTLAQLHAAIQPWLVADRAARATSAA